MKIDLQSPKKKSTPSWWGERKVGQLVPVKLSRAGIDLTLYLADGIHPGPTLLVMGTVHGNEHEGPVSIARLLRELDPNELSGTLIALPVTNPPAFNANTRESPLDGLNLARIFPGKPDGSPSEQLADLLTTEVIGVADAVIDLHSAGTTYEMALLVGYPNLGDLHGKLSREMGLAFGAPVLWEHPVISPGRTLSAATEMGIPCVYTESAGGGGAPPEVVDCYVQGIQRVMQALGMIAGGDAVEPRHERFWRGDGNVDTALTAGFDGLFHCFVNVGDAVQIGDILGEIWDFDGTILQQFAAAQPGIIAMTRRTPHVAAGDGLYLLTENVDEATAA